MNDSFLASLRPALETRVADALKRKAISNRGTFAPFRVPATAQTLVAHLLRAALVLSWMNMVVFRL